MGGMSCGGLARGDDELRRLVVLLHHATERLLEVLAHPSALSSRMVLYDPDIGV